MITIDEIGNWKPSTRESIHRIHNGAQNHQVEGGQASSFKFCKFVSF